MKFLDHDLLNSKAVAGALSALLLSAGASAAELTVVVSDIRSEVGALNVAIYDNPDDWLGDNVVASAVLRVSEAIKDGVISASFELEPGDYAISVHHDDNDNGKMDTTSLAFPRNPLGSATARYPSLDHPNTSTPSSLWVKTAPKCRSNYWTKGGS